MNGDILLTGWANVGVSTQTIWVDSFSPTDGSPVPGETFTIPAATATTNAGVTTNTVRASRAVAVDTQGNLVMAGSYSGVATFGSFTINPSTGFQETWVAKVKPNGTVLWAVGPVGLGTPITLAIDTSDSDNVLLLTSGVQNTPTGLGELLKLSSADGSVLPSWTKTAGPNALFSAMNVDANGNIYIGGYFGPGQTFGGGQPINNITGTPPFLAKYVGNSNNPQWVNYAKIVCLPYLPDQYCKCAGQGVFAFLAGGQGPDCSSLEQRLTGQLLPQSVGAAQIAFDPAGNVVLGSFGDAILGGGIDFGAGVFPTYAEPNIFVSAYSPAAGTLAWAKQVPTILPSEMIGMQIDSHGRIVFSGNYSGSMESDGLPLVTPLPESPNTVDSFLASFAAPSPLSTEFPTIGEACDPGGAPLLTVPADIAVPAMSSAGACVFYMPPTAIDNGNATSGCAVNGAGGQGGPPPGTTVSCSPPPNTTFPVGTTTVTCTATNSLGHSDPSVSQATFRVTVLDTAGPVFSPSTVVPITLQTPNAGGTTVTYAPVATDQVDNNPTSCSACGSPAPPTPQPPPVRPDPPWAPLPPLVSQTPTQCDAPPTSVPVTCTPASGSQFPVGTTTVTCTATDSAGNTSSTSFPVTVLETTPVLSISSRFNDDPIAAGDTIWFTSVIKVRGLHHDERAHLYLQNSNITFSANSVNTTLAVPNAVVTIDPSASDATTTFDAASQQWETTLPVRWEGHAFLAGVELPVTTSLPGHIHPVTWSAQFAADVTGLTVDWAFGAAVYTSFSTNYDALDVKAVDDDDDGHRCDDGDDGHGDDEGDQGWCGDDEGRRSCDADDDPAGTPENFKQFVVDGATGEGHHDYTGDLSRTLRVGPL